MRKWLLIPAAVVLSALLVIAGRTFRPERPVGNSETWTDCSISQAALTTQKADRFTGVIAKESGEFVLKVGSTTYRLDDQSAAAQFEGKRVRIRGTPDPSTNTIQVQEIEPHE